MTNADVAHKITRAHHSRKAVVYLRQSSLAQVKHNTESQRLQYALADTAKLYGFRHIEVIDRDLGLSAASAAPAREGFKELLASIALGEVGLVLSRELSRLSRTDQDWCHLELPRFSGHLQTVQRRCSQWQRLIHRMRRSSGARWSNWSGRAVRQGNWPESSGVVPRPSVTGYVKPVAMKGVVMTV